MDDMTGYVCDIEVTVDGSVLSDYDLILQNLAPQAIRFSVDAGLVYVAPLAVGNTIDRLNMQIYSLVNNNSAWHAFGILEKNAGTGPLTIEWVPSYNVEMWAPPLLGTTGTAGKVNIGWDPDDGFYIENRTADIITGIVVLAPGFLPQI